VLVHDYMTQLGGAERVAGHIARSMPDAGLYTSVHDLGEVSLEFVGGRPWHTSFLQPLAGRVPLKAMLPLLPRAIASLDVSDAEVLISSTSAFGHHARKAARSTHVSLCCTPPRFLWCTEDYFRGHPTQRRVLGPLLQVLRRLDQRAARGVDVYVGVSRHIAGRIESVYGRPALVLHPPVDLERFGPAKKKSGRFLAVSRLVASKRIELAVEAANQYELPLDVIGKGPELRRLRAIAGPTVHLHGWEPDHVVRRAMAEATAVVVPGEEDFGLVMAEAQASGTAPVAFASGGSLDIIEDGVTGHLFAEQTPASVAEAMLRAQHARLDVADLLASAERFSRNNFLQGLDEILASVAARASSEAVPA
jgi:glycosyltransferase involved in cell wall biosynthesis